MTTTEETMMTDHTEMQIPDDVMEAAVNVAFEIYADADNHKNYTWFDVRDVIARAILAERERCARIAENLYGWADIGGKDMDGVKRRHSHVMLEAAAKIRSVDK